MTELESIPSDTFWGNVTPVGNATPKKDPGKSKTQYKQGANQCSYTPKFGFHLKQKQVVETINCKYTSWLIVQIYH